MFFHKLKVSGFLSFGTKGIDLPMESLNVLIGSNGSGKSNLLEVIALFKSVPRDMLKMLSGRGGAREWLWNGPGETHSCTLEALVDYPEDGLLRHSLTLVDKGGRLVVDNELVEPSGAHSDDRDAPCYYRPTPENNKVGDVWVEFTDEFRSGDSFLSFMATPNESALWHLKKQYEQIRLYQNWSFGPKADLRQPCDAHDRSEFLNEGPQGPENLALVLSNFQGENRRQLVTALQGLFDGIVDIACPVTGGTVSLFLEERDGGQIPASRLSDGTLRYLCLLAILIHQNPPPLIVIEEPELGLHPDAVAQVAELLVDASRRTQIVVTTHSRMLIDALSDHPSSVVVCEKENGESRFQRLDGKRLQSWLADYSLGDLWSSGEIGGNRW